MRWLIYALLLFLLFKIVIKASSDARGRNARMRSPGRRPGLDGPGTEGAGRDSPKRTSHEVLGVDADASEEEIRHAYQDKMREYHPDRVANAAAELRELAEARSKEINGAYDALRRDRSDKVPK